MSNRNTVGSRVRVGAIVTSLCVVLGLASCGGGESPSATNTTTPTNKTTTVATPTQNNTLTVIKSGTGTGSVVSSTSGIDCGATCSASIASGISVTLTATPNTGSTFAGWLGACSGAGACTTTMSQARSVVASFTLIPTGGNAITLSLVPARTSGVAPLAVFFDASATIHTAVTTRPFHDLEYTWNFGDTNAGTWANGAQPAVSSKNSATGPVAAHVYEPVFNVGETSRTYIVTLQAFDGTNTNTTTTSITVLNPDTVFSGTNTICIAATSLPVVGAGGCPPGASTALQPNFVTAISNYALTGKRVLFKRGDTFTAGSSARIDKTGPGIVGAFGLSGSAPIVQMTGNSNILLLSSSATPTIKDWRIMDLVLEGLNKTIAAINADGGIDQVTLFRVKAQNMNEGFTFSDSILNWWNNHGYPGHSMWDQLAIVDSTALHVTGGSGGNGAFISAKRFSFLGNVFDDSTEAEHVLRLPSVYKGVINNNTLSRPALAKHVIKLHGPTWLGPSTPPSGVWPSNYTELVIIADNKIIGGINPWTVSIGPQDSGVDERVRDIIIERNWITSGSGSQVGVVTSTSDSTFRNNIIDMTGAAWHTGISISRRGVEPVPDNNRVYNNTIYSGSTGDYEGINIGVATNVTVQNNLGSAPQASGPVMISGAFTIQSNNILNNSPAALFVSATPTMPANFSLKAGVNPARNAGLSSISVFSDFFGMSRPQNGALDIGAVEGP